MFKVGSIYRYKTKGRPTGVVVKHVGDNGELFFLKPNSLLLYLGKFSLIKLSSKTDIFLYKKTIISLLHDELCALKEVKT